jgi:hypothetical protein
MELDFRWQSAELLPFWDSSNLRHRHKTDIWTQCAEVFIRSSHHVTCIKTNQSIKCCFVQEKMLFKKNFCCCVYLPAKYTEGL